MKIATILFVLLISGFSIFSQDQPPPPPPPSTPNPTPEPRPSFARELEIQKRNNAAQKNSTEQIQKQQRDSSKVAQAQARFMATHMKIANLYRKSTDEELTRLQPDPELVRKYNKFLGQPGTGILRLAPNLGCVNDDTVISASENCLEYSMPGGGNSYSFRTRDYRIRRLADINFSDNSFDVSGQLSHGMIANLGTLDLDTISLKSPALAFLSDFKPVNDMKRAQRVESELWQGVDSRGVHYRSKLGAVENSTYVLRSIAYNGDYLRTFDGNVFNEFEYDKRADLIVALSVIDKREDGSITILWKELSRKKSPKIKLNQTAEKKGN